jgi:dienelactone hydrolase
LDIDAVLSYTSALPFVLPTEVIVVGQSTGGWATLAYNSVAHPKVRAFINMAGGRGGYVPAAASALRRISVPI